MISPEEQAKRLTDSLSLSKDQSAKVLAIYQDVDKQRQEIFNANSEDRDAMRTAMRSLMDKTDAKIEALLTAKQKTKYAEMKATRMQRWQNRQQPPPDKPKDDSR
jgi:periplasmic protein CpxP/Spy